MLVRVLLARAPAPTDIPLLHPQSQASPEGIPSITMVGHPSTARGPPRFPAPGQIVPHRQIVLVHFFGLYDGGGNNTRILDYQLFELCIAPLSAYIGPWLLLVFPQ